MLSSLATWVQDVIEQLGYLGVALLVVLENVFPPIPSEIVLPFAGFVAQQGSDSMSAVLVGRCVPLIRSVVSIPAGFRRMKLIPYIAYTFLGSLVWNIALVGAGAVLGENWERVEPVVATFQWIVIVVILAGIARLACVVVQRRRTL